MNLPFTLLIWRDIKHYPKDNWPETVLVRCPVNGIYAACHHDDGWHREGNADHLDGPEEIQPLHFAWFTKSDNK